MDFTGPINEARYNPYKAGGSIATSPRVKDCGLPPGTKVPDAKTFCVRLSFVFGGYRMEREGPSCSRGEGRIAN
jgi:hypothetical protein